ncbi:MAG TPA: nicotinamide-nucleotide adenylyltransferase [Nitrososphaeraceae archaeon]|jgi:nicotinamide-nucleotide adenylyltransferase|nr:nicotinamide-nucleotide adenylyltransferase [Nitrososphaeraceae archaeon]
MNNGIIRGLMVGRFQPFHNGHLYLAKQILQECDELIIAIGSAQFNYFYTDPFTAGERILMIHAALSESKVNLTNCYIIPIVNDENNMRWFAHLKSMVPHFDVFYSGNEFVITLLSKEIEIKIKKPRFEKKREYNGTNIRKLIANMQNWKKLVPDIVYTIILEIGGDKRIKMLLNTQNSTLNNIRYPNIIR